MQFLKADTAVTIKLGPFVDDSDGNTVEDALTISQADVRVSKNGGNFAQKNEASSATHDEVGFYDVPIDGTDTNTEGRLLVVVHESGALPVWKEFMVVNANVYDSLFAAATTDYLQVDAVQVEGSDATDQIRDSVVDDGTRIDASALNTLSSLAPATTIAAAADVPTLASIQAEAEQAIDAKFAFTGTEVDSNAKAVEGVALTGKVGDNFVVFFENGGIDTTNTVDDVGASAAKDFTDAERNQIRYRLGVDGTTARPTSNRPHIGSGSFPNKG